MKEFPNSLNVTLRAPEEADWPGILALAHASAPWAGDRNLEWLRYRQQFDQHAWQRRHYVVEDQTTHQVIAYGGIEEGPQAGIYRMFVVMSPERLNDGLGQHVFGVLLADLKTLNASAAWAREEGRDALLDFFAQCEFTETQRFRLPNNLEIVVMERRLATSAEPGSD